MDSLRLRRMGMAVAVVLASTALAADHVDSPTATADPPADITDLYAWHDDGDLIVALDVQGLLEPGDQPIYDRNVLYTVHIDRNGDAVSDHDIHVRFGDDGKGHHGVQIGNLPGCEGLIEGPVETVIDEGQVSVFAGLRDDPFFFDLTGFKQTVATGTLAFDSSRDFFAGTNVLAIVLRMNAQDAGAGSSQLHIWATTGRLEAP